MSHRALISITILFFTSAFIILLIVFSDKSMPSDLWECSMILYIIGLHYLVFWLLFSRVLGTQRTESILVNTLLTMTVTLIIVIGAEFALRYIFRDVTTTSDNLSYFSSKWNKSIHYNRWGFRERDFDPIKPTDVYRIAVIGDSLAFGQGISERDRFSDLLEEKLNGKSNRKFQVLNFSLPGANTPEEIGFLTQSVLSNKPDFILLEWYINDVVGDDTKNMPPPITIIPQELRHNFVLFYFAHRVLSEVQILLGLAGNNEQYYLDRFRDPNSTASLKAVDTMNLFLEKCRKANIPLGIALFSESYFDRSTKLDFLLERMLDYCKEQGLRCVDTRSVLLPMQGDHKFWASRFDPHPGAIANHLVADQIRQAFGDLWSR